MGGSLPFEKKGSIGWQSPLNGFQVGFLSCDNSFEILAAILHNYHFLGD
jgi:hypothetical protein